MKKQSGITLIALVITIIVLLILAGVSLSLVLGENGILIQAQKSVKDHSEAEVIEQIKLAHSAYEIAKVGGTTESLEKFIEDRLKEALNDNGIKVKENSGILIVELSNKGKQLYELSTGKVLDDLPVSAYPIISATPNNEILTENSKYISDGKTAIIPKGYKISNIVTEQSIDNGLVIIKDENEWVWVPVSINDLNAMYEENDNRLDNERNFYSNKL